MSTWLWKESLNSDGQQFHQDQQNELSLLTKHAFSFLRTPISSRSSLYQWSYLRFWLFVTSLLWYQRRSLYYPNMQFNFDRIIVLSQYTIQLWQNHCIIPIYNSTLTESLRYPNIQFNFDRIIVLSQYAIQLWQNHCTIPICNSTLTESLYYPNMQFNFDRIIVLSRPICNSTLTESSKCFIPYLVYFTWVLYKSIIGSFYVSPFCLR